MHGCAASNFAGGSIAAPVLCQRYWLLDTGMLLLTRLTWCDDAAPGAYIPPWGTEGPQQRACSAWWYEFAVYCTNPCNVLLYVVLHCATVLYYCTAVLSTLLMHQMQHPRLPDVLAWVLTMHDTEALPHWRLPILGGGADRQIQSLHIMTLPSV